MPVGVLEHGVPPAQRGQRRQGAGPGHLVADVVGGAVEGVPEAAPGALDAASRPRRHGRRRGRWARSGPAGTGDRRVRSARAPAAAPRRPGSGRVPGARCAASSVTSGTTSLAASVGVDARTSATRSSSGWSGSCPMADTTGVRIACTARSRASSENGSRSSTEPPPRAMIDHVDPGVALEPVEAVHHLGGGALALHRGVRDLEGDRGPAAAGVLDHVALGGGAGRGDQPHPRGQERQRPLQLGGEQPLRREQLAAALEAGEELAEADHPDLARVERQGAAVGVVRTAARAPRRRRPRPAAGRGCRTGCARRSAAPRCRRPCPAGS